MLVEFTAVQFVKVDEIGLVHVIKSKPDGVKYMDHYLRSWRTHAGFRVYTETWRKLGQLSIVSTPIPKCVFECIHIVRPMHAHIDWLSLSHEPFYILEIGYGLSGAIAIVYARSPKLFFLFLYIR